MKCKLDLRLSFVREQMLDINDVQAYLWVIGYPVGDNFANASVIPHVTGCLCRLEQQLAGLSHQDKRARAALDLLRYREKLNAYLPALNPQLRSATKELAMVLSFMLTKTENNN